MYSSLAGLFLIDFRLIWWTAGLSRSNRQRGVVAEYSPWTRLMWREYSGAECRFPVLYVHRRWAHWQFDVGAEPDKWARVDAGKTGGHNFQSRFNRHHRHHSITSYYYSLTAINIKLKLENDTHFKSHPNHPKVRSRDCDLLNTQFLVSLPKSKKICFLLIFFAARKKKKIGGLLCA